MAWNAPDMPDTAHTQSVLSETGRIADFLDLPDECAQPVALARAVAAGLPVQSGDAVRRAVGPQTFEAVIPGATWRRARRTGARLSRETSEKLYEFSRVRALIVGLYQGDEAAAQRFLERPHAMLGGQTPLALATSSSAGADAVADLLRRAEAGFAA